MKLVQDPEYQKVLDLNPNYRRTALALAERLVGRRIKFDTSDSYDPATGCIRLSCATAESTEPMALLRAAHECRHLDQHRAHPWLFLFRWFLPVTWWLEWDASRFAGREVRKELPGVQIKWMVARLFLYGITYL